MTKFPVLEVKDVCKSFGGVHALKNVDLKLYKNEILGLVGDNAAGKTTLIKIICGAYTPDSGKILLDRKEVKIMNPNNAKRLGIGAVHQELAICGNLNVTNNLFLGQEIKNKRLWGLIKSLNENKMEEKTHEVIGDLGVSIDSLKKETNLLSGGQRQAVALGRVTIYNAKILLLDEPTAAIAAKERIEIFKLIKKMKNMGMSIIYISHNLQEVFSIVDRIMVLRHGEKVGEELIESTNPDEIVKMMTGAGLEKLKI